MIQHDFIDNNEPPFISFKDPYGIKSIMIAPTLEKVTAINSGQECFEWENEKYNLYISINKHYTDYVAKLIKKENGEQVFRIDYKKAETEEDDLDVIFGLMFDCVYFMFRGY